MVADGRSARLRGTRRTVRSQGTVVCAIDLGSRNFKAVVGRVSGGAIVTRLLDKVRLDLGEHLAENRGSVSEAKIAEILDALDALAARGRAEGASKVLAVGTRALREARNAGAVIHAARAAGIEIEVASGEREAELGYLCATGGAPNRLVSDLGSQSLEIAWKKENVGRVPMRGLRLRRRLDGLVRRRFGFRRGTG